MKLFNDIILLNDITSSIGQYHLFYLFFPTMRLSEKPCFSIFHVYGLNLKGRSILI